MPAPKTIIFCGTSDFAVPSLHALLRDQSLHITAVITQPDKPVGRKQELTPPPIKKVAEKHGLLTLQPEDLNLEFASLKLSRPDFLVVVSYGQIVSQEILDFPTIAPINVHPSLLPKLRGASPIQHAILSGETRTGVTIQRMSKELDAGPILAQKTIAINPRETYPSLYDRLSALGAKLVSETFKQPLEPVDQDTAQVTFCAKLSRADGVVDPANMTASEIDRHVRALVPWPGVTWKNTKILATELAPHRDAFELRCKDSTMLYITKLQPAGKKSMSGSEFTRGHAV